MDLLLSNYNKKNRNGKRYIEEDCIIRKREGMLHVCINSIGCMFRQSGSCVMCDYGQGRNVRKDGITKIITLISENIADVDSILVGTLGSILDTREISKESLEMIFAYLNQTDITTVILETHYTTISEKICMWLKEQLPKKDIVIEVGLESVDYYVQDKCLNKIIDLTVLQEKIKLLHDHHMSITANVFLGAPFLNKKAQIEDAKNTVRWAIENNVDSIVIFPANIRKNTLLDLLYTNQLYSRIRQWDVFEVLECVPVEYLNRMYLAWYGDWVEEGRAGTANNLPPYACEICKSKWDDFYHHFLTERGSTARKAILEKYKKILRCECNCYDEFISELYSFTGELREEKTESIRKWLQRYLS